MPSWHFTLPKIYVLSLFQLYPNVYFHKATKAAERVFSALMLRVVGLTRDGGGGRTGLLILDQGLASPRCPRPRRRRQFVQRRLRDLQTTTSHRQSPQIPDAERDPGEARAAGLPRSNHYEPPRFIGAADAAERGPRSALKMGRICERVYRPSASDFPQYRGVDRSRKSTPSDYPAAWGLHVFNMKLMGPPRDCVAVSAASNVPAECTNRYQRLSYK
jgi:hypothetical protein